MSDNNESVTPETVGQNPQWPGEKARMPGNYDKKKSKEGDMTCEEETRIPEVGQRQDPGKEAQ